MISMPVYMPLLFGMLAGNVVAIMAYGLQSYYQWPKGL